MKPGIHIFNNVGSSFKPNIQNELNSVLDYNAINLLEFLNLIKEPNTYFWYKVLANDIGRFKKGVGTRMMIGINDSFFVQPNRIPKHKNIAYFKLVATIRPLNIEVI